jgi:nitric oxide reductase NorQ protein
MDEPAILDPFRILNAPNYIHHGNEEAVCRAAFACHLPLLLKGPTGCGKTRFVEHMAFCLGVPLLTVSCHEDLTAADLIGRFLFKDNQTVWQDGPLTLAVRHGGICYLDEIVEARKDTTVVIHSLTDDRRMLFIDKTGEAVRAHPEFMVVLSYNPGYQSIVKDLKHSTRQRFVSLEFTHPTVDTDARIIAAESGLSEAASRRLAEMGARIRELQGFGLEEGVSTRLLVYAGRLMQAGLEPLDACRAAISRTLTDERELSDTIDTIAKLHFGDLLDDRGHAQPPAPRVP